MPSDVARIPAFGNSSDENPDSAKNTFRVEVNPKEDRNSATRATASEAIGGVGGRGWGVEKLREEVKDRNRKGEGE